MKKCTALLLSLVMIFIAVFSAVNAYADEKQYYLFAYFTGNDSSEQQIRFALSEDGLNFFALNNNNAVVSAEKTSAKNSSGCARDPYISKGNDGYYYMIATDMDATGIHSSWAGDTCLYVWRSGTNYDLTSWEQIADFDVSAENVFENVTETAKVEIDGKTYDLSTTYRAWAPQFIWDDDEKAYMVYWSNYMKDENGYYDYNCPVLYSYTEDFTSFTAPKVLYRAQSGAAIDEDIHYNADDGLYYMYYKDEANATICYVTSESLTGPYTTEPQKVYFGDIALEGANCHIAGGKLTMLADAYTSGYFVALQSEDYKTFSPLGFGDYSINRLSPRHGSVCTITKAQYDALKNKFGLSENTDIQYMLDKPYSKTADWSYETYKDSCGRALDIVTSGSANIKDRKISLVSSSVFINDNVVHDILYSKVFTLSFKHTLSDPNKNMSKLFAISNGKKDYAVLYESGLFYVNNKFVCRTDISAGREYNFALVSDGTSLALYKDGEAIGTINATLDVLPLGNTGYIGLGYSDVSDPPKTSGVYSDIRISDYALTPEQAKEQTAHIHSFTNKVTKSASCSEKGIRTYTCSNCGYSYNEQIPMTAHTVVRDKAVEPTFAKAGKTEGSHCSVCKKVITPQKAVAKLKPSATTVSKVTAGKKAFTVKWKKQTKNTTGYQIQYSTDKNFKNESKTVTVTKNKTTSLTVKKLKAKKKYYVRIRTYKSVGSKKYYSSWSKSKTVTTKK